MQPGLSDWERSFLRNVSKNRRLSAKQQSLVVRLVTQYLESTPSRHRNGIDRFNKFPSFEGKRHSEPAAFGAPQPIRRIIKTERLQKPMKRNDIYPSRWLKATDLPPGGKTLAIERVTEEAIGKDRERKAVATFEGYDKELVINSTNWDSIVELTGQDDSDNWPGHKIKLVRVQVQFGRETVEAIRIRPAIQRSSEKASVPSPVTNDEPVEFGDPY
jgi:hypothetical protein